MFRLRVRCPPRSGDFASPSISPATALVRVRRRGGPLLWRELVRHRIGHAMRASGVRFPLDGALELRLWVVDADAGPASPGLPAVADALRTELRQLGVFRSDAQIETLCLTRVRERRRRIPEIRLQLHPRADCGPPSDAAPPAPR